MTILEQSNMKTILPPFPKKKQNIYKTHKNTV